MCNHDLELIGYASDEKTNGDGSADVKPFDEIKRQQYSTQSVDRIYRLRSSGFVLIQFNSSMKSDRIWPISEQVFDLQIFSQIFMNKKIRFSTNLICQI